MHRALRVLLVWVMAIAIPVQGLAAAAMLSCGPSHARMMQGLLHGAQAAAPGHGHGHGPALSTAADHGAHHGHAAPHQAAPSPAAEPAPTADAAGSAAPQADAFSCSACAACCAMLALPAGSVQPQAVVPAHPERDALVVPVASPPPDGLDRPPRATRA